MKSSIHFISVTSSNPDAKRLYDDLLSNYNKLVRPVVNVSDALTVHIKLKLSQLIDVNLKNQIMTTNLWVEQSWYDYKLTWDPRDYGNVDILHVPSDHIWRPDIVVRIFYKTKHFENITFIEILYWTNSHIIVFLKNYMHHWNFSCTISKKFLTFLGNLF